MMTQICKSAAFQLTLISLALLAVCTGCGVSPPDKLAPLLVQQQTLRQKKQLLWEEVQHLRTLVDSKRDLAQSKFDTAMLLTTQAGAASPAVKPQAEERARIAIAESKKYEEELSATEAKLEDRFERYLKLEEQSTELDQQIQTLLATDG